MASGIWSRRRGIILGHRHDFVGLQYILVEYNLPAMPSSLGMCVPFRL